MYNPVNNSDNKMNIALNLNIRIILLKKCETLILYNN